MHLYCRKHQICRHRRGASLPAPRLGLTFSSSVPGGPSYSFLLVWMLCSFLLASILCSLFAPLALRSFLSQVEIVWFLVLEPISPLRFAVYLETASFFLIFLFSLICDFSLRGSTIFLFSLAWNRPLVTLTFCFFCCS